MNQKFHSTWFYFLRFGIVHRFFIRDSKLEIESWNLFPFQKNCRNISLKEIVSVRLIEGKICKNIRITDRHHQSTNLEGLNYQRAIAIKSAVSNFL